MCKHVERKYNFDDMNYLVEVFNILYDNDNVDDNDPVYETEDCVEDIKEFMLSWQ